MTARATGQKRANMAYPLRETPDQRWLRTHPYGYIVNHDEKRIWFYNRWYNPLSFTGDKTTYTKWPDIPDSKQVWLWGWDAKLDHPLKNQQAMALYEAQFSQFKDYTIEPDPETGIVQDQFIPRNQ